MVSMLRQFRSQTGRKGNNNKDLHVKGENPFICQ